MHSKNRYQRGIAQLVVLGVMAFLALGLPLTTKLVQQNQENRSQAAVSSVCSTVNDRGNRKCSSGKTCLCFVSTNADGTVKEARWNCVDCPSGKTCSSNTGICETKKACTPNSGKKCENGKLYTCNSSGSAWKTPNNCVTGACKSDTACSTVQTVGQKCTSRYKQCANNTAWYCSSGKIAKKVCSNGCNNATKDCNQKPNPTPTKTQTCKNSEKRCSGRALQECVSNSWKLVENCQNGCDSTEKECLDKLICTAKELYCARGYLFTCDDYGTSWKRDYCEYGCNKFGTDCNKKCPPGGYKCTDGYIYKCNENGNEWVMTDSCLYGCRNISSADPYSNTGCNDCLPGSTKCNSSTNEDHCSKDGKWVSNARICKEGCDTKIGQCNEWPDWPND